jgi:hypothetical protein
MKYLETPFEGNVTIQIQNGGRKDYIDCELATSEIEIFQSASFRKRHQFKKPLVLMFLNPLVQAFTVQQFHFDVVQICVGYEKNLVSKVSYIPAFKGKGTFIQCFSGFSMVIFLEPQHSVVNKIVVDKTKISLNATKPND